MYNSEARRRRLAEFLLGKDIGDTTIKNVRPVIFGNKENDLAFLCDDAIYCMIEEQSTICLNMPYRILEYITAALRSVISAEEVLYKRKRIMFPFPKLYVVNVGLEESGNRLPDNIQYDMRLSESYLRAELVNLEPDLEVLVHVYDFRMTYQEILEYIEKIPDRMSGYENELRDYALFVNAIRYVQDTEKTEKYEKPGNVADISGLIELMIARGIFVDLLSDKEVCDLTVAQFSREDIIRHEGIEQGIEQKLYSQIRKKMEKHKAPVEIAEELEEDYDKIKEIYDKILDEKG